MQVVSNLPPQTKRMNAPVHPCTYAPADYFSCHCGLTSSPLGIHSSAIVD